MEPPILSQSVRSTGNLGLLCLAFEVCVLGNGSLIGLTLYPVESDALELGSGTLFTVSFHSQEVFRVVKIIGTEIRLVVARGRGKEKSGELFNGYKVSVLQNGRSSGDRRW